MKKAIMAKKNEDEAKESIENEKPNKKEIDKEGECAYIALRRSQRVKTMQASNRISWC